MSAMVGFIVAVAIVGGLFVGFVLGIWCGVGAATSREAETPLRQLSPTDPGTYAAARIMVARTVQDMNTHREEVLYGALAALVADIREALGAAAAVEHSPALRRAEELVARDQVRKARADYC